MKTTKIRIYGELQGPIWWPAGAICTKEFDLCCDYEDKPFCRQIDCLRDALLHITNDGDFQNCEICFAVLEITKQKGLSRIIRERILQGVGENADCFVEDMIVEYDGGGYDGCMWEWNYFYIDEGGVFNDIASSGTGGITSLENALDLIKNEGNSFSNKVFVYHLDDKDEMRTFATDSNCVNIRGVLRWFNNYNSPDAGLFAICSQCKQEVSDADDIYLIDIHGCGGIMSTADNMICTECYIGGTCGCCDEYMGTSDLTWLGGEYDFDDDYMNKAARKMLDDGYSDICRGCIEEQARQLEKEDKGDLLFVSMSTGKPDMFSNKMRWFWRAF